VLPDVGPWFEDDVAAATEAEDEANDDPILGGCGSGVIVASRVSQTPPGASGLRLRSLSPSPSRRD
jgi:hypothetical protein